MHIDRSDTLGDTTYIMTETHSYQEVLPRLRTIEPRTVPIKHVGTRTWLATGYRVPADAPDLERILETLRTIPSPPAS